MITLYNVISGDGYIARKNGSEDFIPDEVWNEFINLCGKSDVLVMGSKTYEAIKQYPREMIEEFESLKIKRVVVTKKDNYSVGSRYKLIHSIADIISLGKNILISSGPILNNAILKENIADRVILNTLLEKIGTGIPVFDSLAQLKLISAKDMGNGREWREYDIVK